MRPENGLQAVIRDGCGELGEAMAWVYGTSVIEQRCIFHKMRNVADKCREELKGDAKKEETKAADRPKSVRSIKPRVPPRPERGWPPLPTPGKHEPQRRWRPSNATLSKPLPTTVGRRGTRTRAHHLALGAHQSRVAAQVSPSLLLWQSNGG